MMLIKCFFDKRRPFLKSHVSEVIESLEISSAFPNFDEKDPLLNFRKSQVEEVVSCLYIAQPKIFSSSMNKEQRKTFNSTFRFNYGEW